MTYCKKRNNKNGISWRCNVDPKCNAIIHTDTESKNGNIVSVIPNHAHSADIAQVKAKIIKEKIKKKASNTNEKPATIISKALRGVLSPVSAMLPKPCSLQRSVQRARHNESATVVNPSTRGDIVLADEFKLTFSGDCFLVHDSGGDKNRFMIFSSLKNLNHLSQCPQWLADGTFRSAPAVFTQLYTIHGLKENGKAVPLVFLLAPHKTKRVYVNFLKILRDRLPNFCPNRMMVDFEIGFIDAFKEYFPKATVSGCNFHFNQCIIRHFQKCGLQRNYNTDVTFSSNIHLLMASAFVPPQDVVEAYELIVESNYYELNSDLLDSFLTYFVSTWIGKPKHNKKKREKPLFQISPWNVYNAVMNSQIRSNNICEGWHSGFNNLVGNANPTFGAFMESLKDEQSKTETVIAQINSGLNVAAVRRKAFLNRDERIKNIVKNYDANDKFGYLKNLAKIFRA